MLTKEEWRQLEAAILHMHSPMSHGKNPLVSRTGVLQVVRTFAEPVPLSKEAREARRPLPPHILMGIDDGDDDDESEDYLHGRRAFTWAKEVGFIPNSRTKYSGIPWDEWCEKKEFVRGFFSAATEEGAE